MRRGEGETRRRGEKERRRFYEREDCSASGFGGL